MSCTRVSPFLMVCALLALPPACSSNSVAITGTETNWLEQCNEDADCGAYACYCGVCSASCKDDSECDHESVNGSCKPSAELHACDGEVPKRVCVADVSIPDAATTGHDSNALSSDNNGTESATSGAAGSTSDVPTFAYAAVPCEQRAPSQCYQGDECYAIFASELDGNQRVVGCTTAQNSNGSLCASSPLGTVYLVHVDVLPVGWTATGAEVCEPECYSPWRNVDRASDLDLLGCPCTAGGSVCLEGIGMECFDGTDDLRDDRFWQLTDRPCEAAPECQGGSRLTECLAAYETCTRGGVVLDTTEYIYCGEVKLPCAQRGETACVDDCEPIYGTTNRGNQAFGGCVASGTIANCGGDATPLCVQQLTPQTAVLASDAEPVSIETCQVPGGFGLLEPSSCETAVSTCASRNEAACTAPCSPFRGRTSPGGPGEFISCGDTVCSASRTICAENETGDRVEFFGCLAPGWVEINAADCIGD